MRFPVSVKAVVAHEGRVPLCRNERAERELPGGRREPGGELRAEHREARWFAVGDLRAITMPERYKRAIRLSAR